MENRAPTGPGVVTISNVVCTAVLKDVPSMSCVASELFGQFNKCGFAAACRVRLCNPRCTVLVFNVGKLVTTAVRSRVAALEAFHAGLYVLTMKGYTDLSFSDVRIENCASTYYLRHRLDMHKVQNKYPGVMWDKRNFAGANMKGPNGVTMLLFESGKIVITGTRDVNHLIDAASWCDEHLEFANAGCRPEAIVRAPKRIRSAPSCRPWKRLRLAEIKNSMTVV